MEMEMSLQRGKWKKMSVSFQMVTYSGGKVYEWSYNGENGGKMAESGKRREKREWNEGGKEKRDCNEEGKDHNFSTTRQCNKEKAVAVVNKVEVI